jgi:hypothetical protein
MQEEVEVKRVKMDKVGQRRGRKRKGAALRGCGGLRH